MPPSTPSLELHSAPTPLSTPVQTPPPSPRRPDPLTLIYTLSIPYSFTRIIYIHKSDTLQDLTTHKGNLMLRPVRLSTRLLVARKSIESKKKKKLGLNKAKIRQVKCT